MTRLIVMAGLIGLAIAGVAIGMEEAGVWQTRHSLIFFAVAILGFVLPCHYFMWRRKKFKLSYDA